MKPFAIAFFVAALPTLGAADVSISDPWARASILVNRPGAAYLSLTSDSGDRLLAASSPVAGRVMIHGLESAGNGATRMVHLDGFDLPPGETVTLAPGDMHLMMLQLERKLEEGTTFPLTLNFETAGEITVDVPVLGVAATGPGGAE